MPIFVNFYTITSSYSYRMQSLFSLRPRSIRETRKRRRSTICLILFYGVLLSCRMYHASMKIYTDFFFLRVFVGFDRLRDLRDFRFHCKIILRKNNIIPTSKKDKIKRIKYMCARSPAQSTISHLVQAIPLFNKK